MKNTEKLKNFVQWMHARNMAQSSINVYEYVLRTAFKTIDKDSVRISNNDIQHYIINIPDDKSFSYRNQAVNAIKLYFKVVENRKIKDIYLPRPKKQQYIPVILTPQQIESIIFNTENLKHRAILFIIYDNGLRISEALNLTLMDVRTKCEDPHIILRNTKHHSSRNIYISDRCLAIIREYYRQYHPKTYLFEGENGRYSETSVRSILKAALKREGIKEHLRVHDLRHNFATHCLANNTDIYHLSNFLGHKNVKTTQKTYAHLKPNQLNINRPGSKNKTSKTLRIVS